MEEIELGDKDWNDDFSGYETVLPSLMYSHKDRMKASQ